MYIDNGRAFRARFFEGCPDFEQAGIFGLYESLGCKVIHAWPYHGQSKPIERFFGTMHGLEVWMPSYTGFDIAHKPARMKRGEELHRQLYEKMGGRPLTLEETHYQVTAGSRNTRSARSSARIYTGASPEKCSWRDAAMASRKLT